MMCAEQQLFCRTDLFIGLSGKMLRCDNRKARLSGLIGADIQNGLRLRIPVLDRQ